MSGYSLPQRAHRGARMQKLLLATEKDDEIEEVYQEYFGAGSEGSDNEYEEEEEEEDVLDSDFDLSEPEAESSDAEEETIRKQERQERSKGKPRTFARRGAAQGLEDLESDPGRLSEVRVTVPAEEKPKPRGKRPREDPKEVKDGTSPRTQVNVGLRRSTKARTNESAKRAVEAEVKRKETRTSRRSTEDEMLEEAKETEIKNLEDLSNLLSIQEEMKRVTLRKPWPTGPCVRWISRKGGNTITFTETSEWPADIRQKPIPRRECVQMFSYHPIDPAKPVCAITGQRAKYFDPKKKKPFASVEAFKALRSTKGGRK